MHSHLRTVGKIKSVQLQCVFRDSFDTTTHNTVEAPFTWVVDLWVVVLLLEDLMRLLVPRAAGHVEGGPLEGDPLEDPVVHSSI